MTDEYFLGSKIIYCLSIVLEFELRKAQETIKSLRGSLTKATGRLIVTSKISITFAPHTLETNVTEKRKEDKVGVSGIM